MPLCAGYNIGSALQTATKLIQKVPHKMLWHFPVIAVFYSMFFSCRSCSLVSSNLLCVYHYCRIRVQWVKSQTVQTLPDSNYVIWQTFSSLTEVSMALINPRTSYINTSMKFCFSLENANSKHLFWNAWPFQTMTTYWWEEGSCFFPMSGAKLGATHCCNWI